MRIQTKINERPREFIQGSLRIHKEINYGILVIKEDILDIQLKKNDGTILESAIMNL